MLTGLDSSSSLVLAHNAGQPDEQTLTLNADGSFTLPSSIRAGSAYNLSVSQQPAGYHCTISNGSGTVSASVNNIAIACSPLPYALTINHAGAVQASNLKINGSAVPAQLPYGSSYTLTWSNPSGYSCVAPTPTGTVTGAVNITITCSPLALSSYTVGGSVSGLSHGSTLTLKNNGIDSKIIFFDGTFSFALPLSYGDSYNVTFAQPASHSCTLGNGSGVVTGNINNVQVNCVLNRYLLGGWVSGLPTGDNVVLTETVNPC